jgi:hypothetical protein
MITNFIISTFNNVIIFNKSLIVMHRRCKTFLHMQPIKIHHSATFLSKF